MQINFDKIERERKRQKISKLEMSRRLNMSRQSYYDFLKSKPPTLAVLSSIAQILDFDPKDLLI